MTLTEAAGKLGVQPASLRQAIARGSLKATKRGRDWHVTEAQLAAYRAPAPKPGPYSVPCPRCRSGVGDPCFGLGGRHAAQPLMYPHRERNAIDPVCSRCGWSGLGIVAHGVVIHGDPV